VKLWLQPCVPIREIKESGTRASNAFEKRRDSVFARIRMFVLLPRTLKFIIDRLPGDQLGRLDQQQARSLYRHIMPLYSELAPWVKNFPDAPLSVRILFGWWCRRMEVETERLGDIMETLAWGSNNELRKHVESAIGAIESVV
jgi:hypothetical protein